jgi:MYXO-CTERM domain-containing protein
MKTRAALIVAVLGTASSVFAQAQTQGSVTYTLSAAIWHQGSQGWINATAGDGAGGTVGVVDPGEGIRFQLVGHMTGTPGGVDIDGNPLGSPLTWDPTVVNGSSGAGGLGGFWSGDLNLTGTGSGSGGQGSWSDGTSAYASSLRRRLQSWTASGAPGSVASGGSSLTNIQPSQFSSDGPGLNHTNDITFWQGLWIPNFDATARTVNWAETLGDLGLATYVYALDSNGMTLPVPLRLGPSTYNPGVSVNVAAVPGPSSLALLGLGGLIAARRRRS